MFAQFLGKGSQPFAHIDVCTQLHSFQASFEMVSNNWLCHSFAQKYNKGGRLHWIHNTYMHGGKYPKPSEHRFPVDTWHDLRRRVQHSFGCFRRDTFVGWELVVPVESETVDRFNDSRSLKTCWPSHPFPPKQKREIFRVWSSSGVR